MYYKQVLENCMDCNIDIVGAVVRKCRCGVVFTSPDGLQTDVHDYHICIPNTTSLYMVTLAD